MVNDADPGERLAAALAANFTGYWTRLMAANVCSSVQMSTSLLPSKPQAEVLGRRMSLLVSDYARGLVYSSPRVGTAAERAALRDIAESIDRRFGTMQRAGSAPFASYGRSIASAAREADRARTAYADRVPVPVELAASRVARAAGAGDWHEVGDTAAAIGSAGAFGATATVGLAVAIAAIGSAGPPIAVTTFVLSARAAFGDRLNLVCLAHPECIEHALADWPSTSGRDRSTSPDDSPASAVYSVGDIHSSSDSGTSSTAAAASGERREQVRASGSAGDEGASR